MDLEQIERALEKIQTATIKYTDSGIGTPEERMRYSLFTSAAEEFAVFHAADLLRLVRAMRWMEDNAGLLTRSNDHWCFGVRGNCVMFNGDDPLAAIEAAMTTNQPRAK